MGGHTSPVTALALTEDGEQIVSQAAGTGEVRVFGVRRGRQERLFEVPAVDRQWVSVAPRISAAGSKVATFAQEVMTLAGEPKRLIGALQVWDVQTGKEL